MAVYPALLHYGSCPTVRDWIAVYPALFFFDFAFDVVFGDVLDLFGPLQM